MQEQNLFVCSVPVEDTAMRDCDHCYEDYDLSVWNDSSAWVPACPQHSCGCGVQTELSPSRVAPPAPKPERKETLRAQTWEETPPPEADVDMELLQEVQTEEEQAAAEEAQQPPCEHEATREIAPEGEWQQETVPAPPAPCPKEAVCAECPEVRQETAVEAPPLEAVTPAPMAQEALPPVDVEETPVFRGDALPYEAEIINL